MYESGKKPNKPIKLYLNTAALSASKKALNTNDLNKDNYESSENDIRKIHESQLSKIQQLEKELKQIENQNEKVANEMKVLTSEQNKLSDKYNKILKEIDFEKINLEKIKDINRLKNHEYLQKLRIKEELDNKENNRYEQNGENNLNTNSNDNDENRFADALNGFNFLLNLSRFRRMALEEEEEDDNDNNDNNNDNNNNDDNDDNEDNDDNDEGPPLTYNQLQSLPSSKYLKKDNSTEKCIICEFEFCYNDEVTTLKCNHSFHKNCLINRLRARNSSKCPNCRTSII
jgi:hypothetical protein